MASEASEFRRSRSSQTRLPCHELHPRPMVVRITLLIGKLVPSLPSAVPAWALGTGFAVSVAVGIFFGVWPAVKAAQLDPVEALRYA
jgi:ABC-type lipoprotein release transport system permease subunit